MLDALLIRLEADEIGEKPFASAALQSAIFSASVEGAMHAHLRDEDYAIVEYRARRHQVNERRYKLRKPLMSHETVNITVWLSLIITSFLPLSIPTKILLLTPLLAYSAKINVLLAELIFWTAASRLVACWATEWTNLFGGLINPLPVLIPAVLIFGPSWLLLLGPPFALGWSIRWYFLDTIVHSSCP